MAPLSFPLKLKEIGTRAELARRLGVDVRAVDLISLSSTSCSSARGASLDALTAGGCPNGSFHPA